MTTRWNNMSLRERRLALIAGCGVGLMLAYLIVVPAVGYLQGLDMQVESLEEQVYNNTYQAAMSEVVSKRYGELASQHSTGWTEAEISDGLQRELDRLSLAVPKEGGKNPAGGKLLNITYRPEGQLTPYAGYREYQTAFTTQPSSIAAIAEFVRRIQESPQTLRIDKLDLRRESPLATSVVAQITVTRTVVDSRETDTPKADEAPKADVPMVSNAPRQEAPKSDALGLAWVKLGGNKALNPSFELWDPAKAAFPGWEGVNVTFAQDATHAVDGKSAAKVVSTEDKASVFQVQTVLAGQKYRLSFLAAASKEASFDVLDRKTEKPLMAAQPLRADGKLYKYAVEEFLAPGASGETVELAIPRILLNGKDNTVYLDKVELEAVKK